MDRFAQDLQEFLHNIFPDVEGDEAIELDETAVRASAKFGARMKANKKSGKKLTPSKYLKKYGNRWHSLKDEVELNGTPVTEEIDNAPKEKEIKAKKLGAGEIAYQYIKKSGKKIEASNIRRASIDGTLHEAKQPTAKGAAKWERKTKYRTERDKTRNLEGKKEERESKTGIPHASGHGVSESVKPAKGTKKDKRPDVAQTELPIMPSGMNAGMRMMAASFDDFKGDLISELSKDTVYGAYKERLAQAKAHHDIGDKKGAEKNATKALKHAEYHKGYEASREKYAKYKEARAVIAKRAKKPEVKKEAPAPEKKPEKKKSEKRAKNGNAK